MMETDTKFRLKGSQISFYSAYIASKLDDKKVYRVSIKELKESRSQRQNRLFWRIVMACCKDDNSSFNDRYELYEYLLKKAGIEATYEFIKKADIPFYKENKYSVIQVDSEYQITTDKESFIICWCMCYPGSSHFNTKEMSDLIEVAIQYADEIGLEHDFRTDWSNI